MAKYLVTGSYTAESWAAQIENPQNRIEVIGKQMAAMGVNILAGYLAFGDTDIVIIIEGPDDITAASMLMKVASTGAVSNLSTTVLIDPEDAVEAMKKAKDFGYTPPKS
tara:strand:+ start:265 stop:591 length:327 start_codon:yes stop_codon:yes gene_type:complete